MGNWIETLHLEYRVPADYYPDETIDKESVRKAFFLADMIYRFFEEKGLLKRD